mmetsp:Transcript_11601/g.15294  ORF Transcript_11601/g.15294 Transcript_11601/m.15294 type:complete len:643 (+) Transcript_11601:104-2032(+)
MRFQIAPLLLLLASPTGKAFLPHQFQVRAFAPQSTTAREATVTRLPDSAVEIAIEVPGSATKAAYDKVCTEISKSVQIPGFRKGSRIPPQVLEQRMSANGGRNALKVQAINELVTQLVESSFKEESLEPIGQPYLKIPAEDLADSFKPGEPLILPVRCDVWPEIKWNKSNGDKPYVGLTGKYSRKPFNQQKLDKALSDLMERYATNEPVSDSDYALQMGDACNVNMNGFMATNDGGKGEPLPNAASGDNIEVVLGDGRYMEGLVEGIVGAKVGESRQVTVSFPDKLRDKSLAGKKAIFDIEVLEVSKRKVPELTDEFAAEVRAGLTAESLIEELKKAIDQEDAKEYVGERNKALSDALATVMEVEVPDTLVTNQAREKFAVMMADMREGGVADEEIKNQISPENLSKYKEIVKDDIVRDFKVSLATDEIARVEGISVPDYQIEEQMEAIRKDAAETNEEIDEKMIRGKVESTLSRQAVMEWLAENSNLEVEYKQEEGFDENLMQKLADEALEREEMAEPVAQNFVDAEIEKVAEAQPEPVVAEVEVEAEIEKVAEAPVAEPVVAEVEKIAEPPVAEPEPEPVVAEVPLVEEPAAEPETVAVAPAEPEAKESAEEKADRYASMDVGERAFAILKDLGMVGKDS